jgi:hypothetical protein
LKTKNGSPKKGGKSRQTVVGKGDNEIMRVEGVKELGERENVCWAAGERRSGEVSRGMIGQIVEVVNTLNRS